jgi:hypothetical protein
MAPEFGAGIVSDKQYAWVGRIWRYRPELIAPKFDCPACFKFACDQANGDLPFARVAGELEVHQPHFAIRVEWRSYLKPQQIFDDGMVGAVNKLVTQSDIDQLLESFFRPFWFTEIALCLENFVPRAKNVCALRQAPCIRMR